MGCTVTSYRPGWEVRRGPRQPARTGRQSAANSRIVRMLRSVRLPRRGCLRDRGIQDSCDLPAPSLVGGSQTDEMLCAPGSSELLAQEIQHAAEIAGAIRRREYAEHIRGG